MNEIFEVAYLLHYMCFQIWQLRVLDNGGVSVEVLSDLTRHNRAVNVVRFSPEGDYLASADDGKIHHDCEESHTCINCQCQGLKIVL